MAEKEVKTEKLVKDERTLRWEAHLDAYKKKNPAKYAVKEARGEFKNAPAGF